MTKIFDCFLYNGENNLLDIRLNYLYNYVDYFVVVESCQTFQAKKKKFLLEKNFKKINKFKKKIIYFKNNIFAKNVSDLEKKINDQYPEVFKNLSKLDNFNKNDFTWYLDSFHREIIIEAIKNKIEDDDVFILSDLDEIPSYKLIANSKSNNKKINVLKQKEFRYFYNTLFSSDWKGTIITTWKQAKIYGLNNLRLLSKKTDDFQCIKNGGYHFSTMGPIDNINKKINEWGHSEFNNSLIKSLMKYRYKKGLDIFFISNHQLKILSLSLNNFDKKMLNLIEKKSLIKNGYFNKVFFLDKIVFYLIKILLLFFKIKRKVVF